MNISREKFWYELGTRLLSLIPKHIPIKDDLDGKIMPKKNFLNFFIHLRKKSSTVNVTGPIMEPVSAYEERFSFFFA